MFFIAKLSKINLKKIKKAPKQLPNNDVSRFFSKI